jgi:hypothetical protein
MNYELINTNTTCPGVASGEAGSKTISNTKKCVWTNQKS